MGSRPAPVAVIVDGLESGGTQRVAALLMTAWVAEGRQVSLITLQDAAKDFYLVPPEVNRTVVGGVGASPHPLAGLLANLRRIRRLRRALRASGAKSVLAFLTSMNVLAIFASLGLKLRVVVSERNDPLRQDPGLLWRALRCFSYRFADAVTANSRHAVEVMAGYVPRRKLAMVPNPVQMPAASANPETGRVLLNLGRLVPQKGQATILAAFARLSNEFPDWRLVILGDGPERPNLERRIAEAGLGARAVLPGTVADPSTYYEKAGIFVLASAYEGTPNALLEAMAHGLPCVVPDCLPGALEHVENGVSGLVFRAADEDDLARCLALLMRDTPLRVRLGKEARERMKAYSIERIASRWNDLLFPESIPPDARMPHG